MEVKSKYRLGKASMIVKMDLCGSAIDFLLTSSNDILESSNPSAAISITRDKT